MHFKRGIQRFRGRFMLLRRGFTFLKKREVHIYENNIISILLGCLHF